MDEIKEKLSYLLAEKFQEPEISHCFLQLCFLGNYLSEIDLGIDLILQNFFLFHFVTFVFCF